MTDGEQFLGRLAKRISGGLVKGWEIILPLIFDFITAMLEQCKAEAVLEACEHVSMPNRLRARRECMRRTLAAREENGWSMFEAARMGRIVADQLIEEAEATVAADKKVAAGIVDEFLAVA